MVQTTHIRLAGLAAVTLTTGLLGWACGGTTEPFTVVDTHPHEPSAYTQGLEFLPTNSSILVESTGLYGQSSLRLVEAQTGEVLESKALDDDVFGEGLTVVDDATAWQITWQSGVAYRWDLNTMTVVATASYEGQGWGLCFDETRLIMSDGTDQLTFRSPDTFAELGTISVTDDGQPVTAINELECVGGRVWANLYQRPDIVVINPETGEVTNRYDLTELIPEGFENSREFVLNGIAADPWTGHLWVTGKQWPVIYELDFED